MQMEPVTRARTSRVVVPTETFVALTGQRDNIGDSMLRRGLLGSIPRGSKRHVLVGPGSEDYSTGLGIVGDDVIYAGRRAWVVALVRTALRRRVCLVMNAGEMTPDRAFIRARLPLVPVIWLIRLRGGYVIQAGLGVKEPLKPASRTVRRLVTRGDLVAWRDEATRAWARQGTVCPDWAFLLGSNLQELTARHTKVSPIRVVLSLRGDRPEPSAASLERLRSMTAALDAVPVVACQVRRDGDRCAWLARELGAELIAWPADRSHVEQEQVLRAEYARATWVASDRLHVVIAAMSEGAVPLAGLHDPARKVARTLAGIDLVPVSPTHATELLDQSRAELRAALVAARARLGVISERVADLVERRSAPTQIRVLHSIPGPDATTRYATHMAATEDLEVRPVFFSWSRALFGRYERFHLHWAEHLVPSGIALQTRIRRGLASALIVRLESRRTPTLRTVHNLTPHDPGAASGASRLRNRLEALAEVDIHLVEGDPVREGASAVLIPHGSYREPYAVHPVPARTPGRVLFFGMLKRYKGIPELLSAFAGSTSGSLRIVGAAIDLEVVKAVRTATELDSRITSEFGFVSDASLALEIGAAELVALPYHELHSSGVALVALSLARPVLVPRTVTTEGLAREVGPDWIRLYDGPLTAAELSAAQIWAADASDAPAPNLAGRNWGAIRSQHAAAYSSVGQTRHTGARR